MKLGNESQAPALSLSFTKDQISTENTSVGIFKCYVTAELSVSHVTKDFTIGDGRNYKRVSTSRRRRETDGFLSFYNRPLEAGLFYAAFQRTFKDEDTYYSSSWTEPIQTLTITRTDPDPDASINSGAAAVYAGVAIGVVILIIIAAVIVLLVLKKRRRRKSDADRATTNIVLKQVPRDSDISKVNIAADHDDDADTDSETDVAGGLNDQEAVYGNFNVNSIRDTYRMVPVEEFPDYVTDMKKNGNYGFGHQYKELPQGIAFPCTIAKRPEHKLHNRYVNMVSYDDALVKLSGEEGNNYINASFIEGTAPKTYIATQGPLSKTITAFWKMVWEQNSNTIIMLTRLKEKAKVKCAQYWPEKAKTYGDITVSFQSKQAFPYYDTSSFVIAKGEEQRFVTQFHFTAWPDHGVPKYPTQLLAFQHSIRSTCCVNGPMICHCSAGVGRTGTFVAIDDVLQRFGSQKDRSVDVFGILQEMRKCRVNMVQTLEQYLFIHEAILEYLLCGVNEIEGTALDETVEKLEQRNRNGNKMTGFEEMFQRLEKLSPVLSRDECTVATLRANSKKNRTLNVYPMDSARVTLSRRRNSDYINATFVNGYKNINAYIATDHPLTNTFADFWQMIYERQCSIIVMLNNFAENKQEKQLYPEYFPVELSESVKYANYFVRLEEKKEGNSTVFRKFSLSTSSDFRSKTTVRHFQSTQWPKGGVPSNIDHFIDMIDEIGTAKRQNIQGPLVVHSGTGTGRTGTFLALDISLESLKAQQRVDIFQCIKLIREKRPQFVENADQLQFCYELLARYVSSFEGYSNFDPFKS